MPSKFPIRFADFEPIAGFIAHTSACFYASLGLALCTVPAFAANAQTVRAGLWQVEQQEVHPKPPLLPEDLWKKLSEEMRLTGGRLSRDGTLNAVCKPAHRLGEENTAPQLSGWSFRYEQATETSYVRISEGPSATGLRIVERFQWVDADCGDLALARIGPPAPEASPPPPTPRAALTTSTSTVVPASRPGQPPAAAPANSCGGVDGTYGIAAFYKVEVKFGPDTLTVVEPNHTSVYRHIGGCQYAFVHPDGIEYRMGVVKNGLTAYKPGQSEAQMGRLALLSPAMPQTANACRAESIPVENPAALHPGLERMYGTRSPEGLQPVGKYVAPEPDGHPLTKLDADGTGLFEVYGAPNPEYVYRIRRWYIQTNCDGTPVRQEYPVATLYFLIYELDRPYQGLQWRREGLAVRKDEARIALGDRNQTPF